MMKTSVVALLVALICAVCGPSAALAMGGGGAPSNPSLPFYGKSYAVVVGIGRYPSAKWTDLSYARKDAEGMAASLRAQGFEVTALYDRQATREAIISALEDGLAPRLNRDDRVLLFFSGHGDTQTLGGTDYGYLVPYNGGSTYGSLISMETLRSLSAKMSAAKHQLFIIDACFGGLFAPTKARIAGISRSHPRYVREVTRRDARQFLTAGGKGQQVLDGGPNGYSYFTGYLLEALDRGLGDLDGDGYITLSELATYLVPRATNDFQTPGMGTLPGHALGEFMFLAPGGARSAAARPPEPPPQQTVMRPPPRQQTTLGLKGRNSDSQQEIVFWQSISSSTNADDYRAYIVAFPNGTFARLARNRIRQYGGNASSAAAPVPTPPRRESAPARRPPQIAALPPDDGLMAYYRKNPHDVRYEFAHFLNRRFTIIGGALEVSEIWKFEPGERASVGGGGTATWTKVNFDVATGRNQRDNKDAEFLLEVRDGRLIVHDVRRLDL